MAKQQRRKQPQTSLLPRNKRERRQVEFLGGVATSMFGLLIMCVFLVSGADRYLLSSPQVAAVVSAVLVDLANGDRSSNSLPALKVNPVLVEAAQAKANDMATYGYFAHVSPQGVDPWHWFQQANYTFTYAGENLAVDFSDSGDVNTAWMNSPTHRGNILDPHYTEIGIATAQGMYQGKMTTFVVQEFGTPATAKTQAPVRTASVPAAPTTIAVASTETGGTGNTRVLGSATAKPPAKAPVAVTTSPTKAASLAQAVSGNVPVWGYIVGFPREAMHYAYYFIGILIILALALETGFEFRWHHRKHAYKAGMLLLTMALLFIVADAIFFAPPVVALVANVIR